MKILVKEKYVCGYAHDIQFGVYDEDFEKWALYDENEDLMYYMVDDGFELFENVEIPKDFVGDNYLYENGEFVLNEEWKPYVSTEERIAQLEEQLANLSGGGSSDVVWDEMALAIEEGVNEV